jgi:hypothetical protein
MNTFLRRVVGNSFPAAQDRSHHARATPPVHDCDNPQRLFIRGIGNQVFTYQKEAQGSCRKIRPFVA